MILNCETIILITSLFECPMTHSVYTREQRYEQTKKTIQSIKEKNIPNVCIMFIDCTKLTIDEQTYINRECDIHMDCSTIESVKNKVYSSNKSDGEKSYLLHALDYIHSYPDLFSSCKHFFKLSGRYWLDDKFDFSKYDIDDDVIQTVDHKLWANACVSCLFKLKFENLTTFKRALIMYEQQFARGMCTEHFLYQYIYTLKNKAYNLSVLGCGGLIAINGIEGHC